MKVAVIGAGVMGCAAAAALARRGADVQLFERETIGAATSSSMGPSRIIRLSYDEIDYVRLSQQGFRMWRALESERGASLLVETGGIDIADSEDASLDRIAEALTSAGVGFQLWDEQRLMQAYPQCAAEGLRALLQPETAVLFADRCVAALAAAAGELGTLIRERTEVEAILPGPTGVTVETESGSDHFDRIILCAGPSIGGFLEALGLQIPLTISMEQSVYFATDGDGDFEPGRFPICIGRFGERGLTSIFPALDTQGVKMMIEAKTAAADPQDFDVDQAAVERVEQRARKLMPALTGRVTRVDRARYTLLPDEDFLIDRHPNHSDVIICSACSGHGFKFAPVIGEMVADLAEGRNAHPRFRYSPERFAQKAHAA